MTEKLSGQPKRRKLPVIFNEEIVSDDSVASGIGRDGEPLHMPLLRGWIECNKCGGRRIIENRSYVKQCPNCDDPAFLEDFDED